MDVLKKGIGILRNPRPYLKWSMWRSLYHYRFVLKGLKEITHYGVKLDVSAISPLIKNSIHSGQYEKAEVDMCREILDEQDCILELGSAIGFLGIYCLKSLGVADYYSVEANPAVAKLLRTNYSLNGLQPKLLEAAVSNRRGGIDFFLCKDFWSSSTLSLEAACMDKKITVEGLLFEDILAAAPFTCTAMIVDIEGGEQFLSPASIPSSVKKLVIELHPEVVGVSGMFEYLALLIASGFKVVNYSYTTFALVRGIQSQQVGAD